MQLNLSLSYMHVYIIAQSSLRDSYICGLLFMPIYTYMYINYIIVLYFNSIIMFLSQDICRKNIMKLVSNGVTKHPNL